MADTAMADTAMADNAMADAAMADTAMADTAMADTAMADAALPDSGASDVFARDAAAAEASANDGPPLPSDAAHLCDASIPPVPCGTVDVFRDDFSSMVFSPIWDSSHVNRNQVPVVLDGDKITFTVTQQTFTSPVWSSIRTWPAASLRNGRMTIEVVDSTFAAGEGAWAFFEFVHDSHNLLLFN
ncbi:MAG: hypothetical protein JXR83_22895, partial [Deltaproteobacteria bacterium]|nr:hypothetical protein [Deltaproteobacteria bacterium]